jgi:hypothetical protein
MFAIIDLLPSHEEENGMPAYAGMTMLCLKDFFRIRTVTLPPISLLFIIGKISGLTITNCVLEKCTPFRVVAFFVIGVLVYQSAFGEQYFVAVIL